MVLSLAVDVADAQAWLSCHWSISTAILRVQWYAIDPAPFEWTQLLNHCGLVKAPTAQVRLSSAMAWAAAIQTWHDASLASDDQTPVAGLVAPVQIAWRCYALTVAEAGAGVSPSCLAQIADLLNRQAVRRIVSG